MPRKIDVKKTINEFKKVHNQKYDYSKSVFINSDTKIEIVCPNHGSFWQRIYHHKKGTGCPECNPRKKMDLKKFKEKCKKEFGNEIVIDFKTFKNTQSKIKAKCLKHGNFEQYAYNFLRGKGCPKCGYELGSNKRKKGNEKFISDSIIKHGDKYDYSKIEYKNAHTDVIIVCPIHGEFKQRPSNHLNGSGCPKCGQERTAKSVRNTLKYFKENSFKTHKGEYDYSLINSYINNKTKVKIICPKHGNFEQQPIAHLLGQRCPKCAIKISKAEQEIADFIKSLGLDIKQSDRNVLDGYEIDILIPELKYGIEYNGLYFHREGLLDGIGGGKTKFYHLNKTEKAKEKGFNLIHIFEDEWLSNPEIIKAKLSHIFKRSNSKIKIGARKCKVKHISHNESKDFLKKYHIQGYDNAKLRYGAYYENQLVGLMTFVETKRGSNIWKLNRYATNHNYHIVGLASKLLKAFEREISPQSVITFADRRYTLNEDKNLYTAIGFKLVDKTEPAYYYVKKNEYIRHNRVKFMKHKLLKEYPQFDEKMTEKEITIELGYDRVYDCGNFKFEKKYDI
jgi:hypothetical protein